MKANINPCKQIGEIGVDAGLCWIGDPCYILHKEQPPQAIGKDWGEFCNTLDSNSEFHQYDYDLGHPGLGVVVSTGYGDGVYPVYAEFNEEGRIAKVWVEFIGQDEKADEAQATSTPNHSPAPWGYEYSPYTVRSDASPLGVGAEIPAYEIFDADGNKVFDSNEDSPAELQETNACLGAAAPRLLASLVTCANLLADYDASSGEEGDAYREALAAIAEATGRPV